MLSSSVSVRPIAFMAAYVWGLRISSDQLSSSNAPRRIDTLYDSEREAQMRQSPATNACDANVLVAQTADTQIRPLRHEKDVLVARHIEFAAPDRPQLSKQASKRGLAYTTEGVGISAPVATGRTARRLLGSGDEDMLARSDLQRQLG